MVVGRQFCPFFVPFVSFSVSKSISQEKTGRHKILFKKLSHLTCLGQAGCFTAIWQSVTFPKQFLSHQESLQGKLGVHRFMRLSLIERSMKSMNSPHLGLPGPSCCDQVFDAVRWVLCWKGKHFSTCFSGCLSNCTTPCEISGLNVIARHYEGPSQQDGHF